MIDGFRVRVAMSPASVGNLEVERYIGACLIARNSSKNGVARNNGIRDPGPDRCHQQGVNYRLQRCQSVDGWAGGVPLISFTNHPRRPKEFHRFDETDNPLARLAVHTQGAPLILSRSYNHRKNNVHRNMLLNNFDGIKSLPQQSSKCQQDQRSVGVDTVSVTSDESSCSNNSETCLPRIIKPRKRRKKDRKPPVLSRSINKEGSDKPYADHPNLNISFESYLHPNCKPYVTCEPSRLIERFHLAADISETPKLHHSFEDIEEPTDDAKDINGNESSCQCRYCDPSGQIWDVDRNCYSPFLTPPNNKTFDFPNQSSLPNTGCIEHSMSSMSLEETKSPSSPRDLEVSTEIVTSLNGHRDLEIRFFTLSSGSASNGGQYCGDEVLLELKKCPVDSVHCEFQ